MSSNNHPGYSTGRTVKARNLQYLHRPADDGLLVLCRTSQSACILTSPQMGKSSMIARTAERLAHEQIRPVIIDLSQFPIPPREEDWFEKFLLLMDDALDLSTDAAAWWEGHRSLPPKDRLMQAFEEILLPETTAPIVLFLDEIERTLLLSFRSQIFSWLSALDEKRQSSPLFQRVSIVLCGVATPSQLLPEGSTQLFQLNQPITLTDFTLEEVLPLAAGLSLPLNEAEAVVQWVYQWTQGHPYLTQLFCQVIEEQTRSEWTQTEVDDCIRHYLVSPQGLQDRNLQLVRSSLTEPGVTGLSLIQPYLSLLEGQLNPVTTDPAILGQLRLTGVIREEHGRLAIRNAIYQEVFPAAWAKRYLPPPARQEPQAITLSTETPLPPPAPVSAQAPAPEPGAGLSRPALVAAALALISLGFLLSFLRPVPNPPPVPPLPRTEETASRPPASTPDPQGSRELAEARKKVNELERALADHRTLSEQHSAQLEEARESFETQLTAQQQELSQAHDHIQQLETALAEERGLQEQELARIRSERDELADTLAAVRQDVQQSHEQLDRLQLTLLNQSALSPEEVKKLTADRSRMETQLASSHQALAAAQSRGRELESLLAQQKQMAQAEHQRLIEDRGRLESKIKGLETALADTRGLVQSVEASAKEKARLAQTELASLQEERGTLQDLLKNHQQAIRTWQSKAAELEQTVDRHARSLEEAHRAKTQLTEDLRDVQSRESRTQDRLRQLEAQLGHQQEDALQSMTALQQERDRLGTQLSHTQRELNSTKTQLATVKDQLSATKNQAVQHQQSLAAIHASSTEQARQAEERFTQMASQQSTLEDRVRESQVSLTQAREQIRQLESQATSVPQLESTLTAVTQERDRYASTLRDTQQQLVKAKQHIETLEHSLKVSSTFSALKQKQASPSTPNAVRGLSPKALQPDEVLKVFTRITANLSNEKEQNLSETPRRLWARQAYLFNQQLGNLFGSTIDPILREALPPSLNRLNGPKESLHAITFNPTGELLVGGASDGSVLIWAWENSPVPQKFLNHSSSVLTVAFKPDGHVFASGSQDSNIRLWTVGEPAKSAKLLQGHVKSVTVLLFSPDGKTLISGGEDRTIRLWDLTKEHPTHTILGTHSDQVNALAITPDGRHLVSAGRDARLFMWDLRQIGSRPKILSQNPQKISTMSMHPVLPILATGGQDQPLTIWDLSQPLPIPILVSKNIRSSRQVQFHPTGEPLAILTPDNTIHLWQWEQVDTTPTVLSGHRGRLETVVWGPRGLMIAGGGKNMDVTLWSSTGQLAEEACRQVTRNLSFEEWNQWIGDTLPYERTCDNLPLHPSFLEKAKKLAVQGETEQAIAMFSRAKTLDPYLDLDPEKEVEKLSAGAS